MPRVSKEAIDFFLTTLPHYSGLKPERVVFVIDGIQPQLYDSQALESVRTTYFGRMRGILHEPRTGGGLRCCRITVALHRLRHRGGLDQAYSRIPRPADNPRPPLPPHYPRLRPAATRDDDIDQTPKYDPALAQRAPDYEFDQTIASFRLPVEILGRHSCPRPNTPVSGP